MDEPLSNVRRSSSTSFTQCIHTFTQCQDSPLALVATRHELFAGTQRGSIYVWNMETMQLRCTLKGHQGHILSLLVNKDQTILFSAGDENMVCVWNIGPGTDHYTCIYVVHAGADCGDIHALAFNDATNTLYLGCKDASLQWFDLSECSLASASKVHAEWASRDGRFFPSMPPTTDLSSEAQICVILEQNIKPLSHNGFVYALATAKLSTQDDRQFLISGAGDGTVKVWGIEDKLPELFKSLQVTDGSVLALLAHEGLLFIGTQGGDIKVWDLETFQCIRSLTGHRDDVLCLAGIGNAVFSGSADGTIKKWTANFLCMQTLQDHQRGIVLDLAVGPNYLASSCSSRSVHVWEAYSSSLSEEEIVLNQDRMVVALEKFVAIPTVSADPAYREECRRGAKFLRALFKELGAETKLIPGAEGFNPLVVAKFQANHLGRGGDEPKHILFYGHYDVQPANEAKWDIPPFELTGKDGYYYGRGVTDDKGPILATLFAVSELLVDKKLGCHISFIIEGEEESGSVGFYEAVARCKDFFGNHVDTILLSNSYWINDEQPCLTYGLRGVIHAKIEISSIKQGDLHSGVDGGAYDEPLNDLVKVLSKLCSTDKNVLIPGWYEGVRPVTREEEEEYRQLTRCLQFYKGAPVEDAQLLMKQLMSRWRLPSLTIHKVDVSGPGTTTVIPHTVTAYVSMRIVPDQSVQGVCSKFEEHVGQEFKRLQSRNQLKIMIGNRADWWLADVQRSKEYGAALKALEKVWSTKPLLVREGGSIPAIPFLESEFKANAVHIPMGQASDNAHLPNERIRVENLMSGRRVMKEFFLALTVA